MIERAILEYLTEKLPVPVYLEVPEGEKSYVVIEKTGGAEENYIKTATFAVQSIAETLYKAADLNELVKDAMREIEELDEISRCSLNTDYNFTDTSTKTYRYQAVYNLVHY